MPQDGPVAAPPLVLVEWRDSRLPTESWSKLRDLPALDACACVSVGFVVGDDSETLLLAPNLGDLGDDDGAQALAVLPIPARAITRRIGLVEVSAGEGAT